MPSTAQSSSLSAPNAFAVAREQRNAITGLMKLDTPERSFFNTPVALQHRP